MEVHLFEVKPNPLFPVWMTERTRFLRYSMPVACAYCHRRTRHHWSMLLAFHIMEGFERKVAGKVVLCDSFVATPGEETFPPLTPVCRTHMLEPITK